MKKILTALTIIILTFGITTLTCGCGQSTEENEPAENTTMVFDNYYSIEEWISPDGVHYWYMHGNKRAALTPRYDNKGNLIIDKQ